MPDRRDPPRRSRVPDVVEVDARLCRTDPQARPRRNTHPSDSDLFDATEPEPNTGEISANALAHQLGERMRHEAELRARLDALAAENERLRTTEPKVVEAADDSFARGQRTSRWVLGFLAGFVGLGGAGAIGAGVNEATRNPRTATVDVTKDLQETQNKAAERVKAQTDYLQSEAEAREARNQIVLAVLCCKGARFRNVKCDEVLGGFGLNSAKACQGNPIVTLTDKDWPDPRLPPK